jgi:hypothetical protein
VAHLELCEPALWWRRIESILPRAYEGVGYPSIRAAQLAGRVHERYIDVAGWQVFDDTLRRIP